MTQRTHDLAAVSLVSARFLIFPPTQVLTWETLLAVGVAAFLGSAIPDIDNVASKAWKFTLTPWEDDSTRKAFSGHRNLSHSLIGVIAMSLLVGWVLNAIRLPHIQVIYVQQAFAIGLLSHLFTDSLTRDGVPWFYPIDIHLGFPPFRALRMKTGGVIEKAIFFPLLLLATIWVFLQFKSNLPLLISTN